MKKKQIHFYMMASEFFNPIGKSKKPSTTNGKQELKNSSSLA